MDKKKVLSVTVEFEDGEKTYYWFDTGTFSEYRNGRKGSPLEWTEYHITWVMYDQEPEPTPVDSPTGAEPEHRQEEAWCGIHKMSPGDCFKLHNPTAFSGRASDYLNVNAGAFARAVDEEIKREIEYQKSKHPPILEEFDITDLLQGYGNGSIRSNGT